MDGNLIYNGNKVIYNNTLELNHLRFSKGLYLVRIENNKYRVTTKIIKQ